MGQPQTDRLQQFLDRIGQPILAVQVDTLIRAFRVAVGRFVEASEQDPEWNRRIDARLDKIFTNVQAQADVTPDPL